MIVDTLKELGVQIPLLPKPSGSYIPAKIVGNLIYASGQTPTIDDEIMYAGKVGQELTLSDGYQAARLACINCLAEIQYVIGNLESIKQIVKVTGFVRSGDNFQEQPKVVNGASELLISLFGEPGRHSRTSIGVSELSDGAAVVIEIIAEIQQKD